MNSQYDTTLGKKRKTTNVYQKAPLPDSLNRVALLPLYKGNYEHHDFDSVEDNFRMELVKRGLFEVVTVTPEAMGEMFAKERYSSVEFLPTDMLTKLSARYAVDGLLLLDLSYFNAYTPVGLGIRAKLLDGHTGELVWAAGEIFDASNPAVSNAARKFYKTESTIDSPLHDTQAVLHSPSRFLNMSRIRFLARFIYKKIKVHQERAVFKVN